MLLTCSLFPGGGFPWGRSSFGGTVRVARLPRDLPKVLGSAFLIVKATILDSLVYLQIACLHGV